MNNYSFIIERTSSNFPSHTEKGEDKKKKTIENKERQRQNCHFGKLRVYMRFTSFRMLSYMYLFVAWENNF